MRADIAIIGGGIVGLATAYQLARREPRLKIVVLEKELDVGLHQSGRNSGVIHSGLYYRPGSLKARLCREGRLALEQFATERGIPFERCGKVVVATHATELPALQRLEQRARENDVACRLIGTDELRELEPHASGLQALHVADAGIIHYPSVCRELVTALALLGEHEVRCGARVLGLHGGLRPVLHTEAGDIEARYVVNCAGLHSDRVARLLGATPPVVIIPFQGQFYELRPEAQHLVRNLIYPVPDARFPFLGVHFTRSVLGGAECGPNAVLALGREAYTWREGNLADFAEALASPGLQKLGRRYLSVGMTEIWGALSKQAFTQRLRRLVPEINSDDLIAAPAGIRAQAVSPDGQLLDDFVLEEASFGLNVYNAPSPAATACLAIGGHLADRLLSRVGKRAAVETATL